MCLPSGLVASVGLTPPGGDWILLVAVEDISRLLIYKYYYGLHYVPGGYTFVGDMRFPGLVFRGRPVATQMTVLCNGTVEPYAAMRTSLRLARLFMQNS